MNISRRATALTAAAAASVLLIGTGGAVAGTLITSAQIKDNTIQSRDVKNGSLGIVDLSAAARRSIAAATEAGPAGPAGPAGAIGPAGPAGPAGAASTIPGPAGPKGEPGTNGTNGTNGAPGANGKTILNGTGAPDDTIGTDGDFYLDTESQTLYGPKANGAYPDGVSLKGANGGGAAGEIKYETFDLNSEQSYPIGSPGTTVQVLDAEVVVLGGGECIGPRASLAIDNADFRFPILTISGGGLVAVPASAGQGLLQVSGFTNCRDGADDGIGDNVPADTLLYVAYLETPMPRPNRG